MTSIRENPVFMQKLNNISKNSAVNINDATSLPRDNTFKKDGNIFGQSDKEKSSNEDIKKSAAKALLKMADSSPAFGKPASKDDKLDAMLLTTKVVDEPQSFIKKPVPIKIPI